MSCSCPLCYLLAGTHCLAGYGNNRHALHDPAFGGGQLPLQKVSPKGKGVIFKFIFFACLHTNRTNVNCLNYAETATVAIGNVTSKPKLLKAAG